MSYPEQLESAARSRTLQSRVLNRKVDELKRSMLKRGLAEEIEPVIKMMEIMNEEEDLKTEVLIYLLNRDAEVSNG